MNAQQRMCNAADRQYYNGTANVHDSQIPWPALSTISAQMVRQAETYRRLLEQNTGLVELVVETLAERNNVFVPDHPLVNIVATLRYYCRIGRMRLGEFKRQHPAADPRHQTAVSRWDQAIASAEAAAQALSRFVARHAIEAVLGNGHCVESVLGMCLQVLLYLQPPAEPSTELFTHAEMMYVRHHASYPGVPCALLPSLRAKYPLIRQNTRRSKRKLIQL